MNIRRLEVSDAPLLHALRVAVDAESPGPLGPAAQRQRAVRLQQITLELAAQQGATFGAFLQDKLVGAASIAPTPSVPNWFGLFGVAVTSEFRGQKISRALVCECLAHAASSGAEGVTLVVSVPNPAAKSLYESLGFEVWNTSERAYVYEGTQYDELSMRRFLKRA